MGSVGVVSLAAPTFPAGTSDEEKAADLIKRLCTNTEEAQLRSCAAGVGQLAKEAGPILLEVRWLFYFKRIFLAIFIFKVIP
jgi:hypothetical protein